MFKLPFTVITCEAGKSFHLLVRGEKKGMLACYRNIFISSFLHRIVVVNVKHMGTTVREMYRNLVKDGFNMAIEGECTLFSCFS